MFGLLVLTPALLLQPAGHATRLPSSPRMSLPSEVMSSRRGVLPFTDTLASNVGARAAARGESLDVASTYAGCVPEPLDAKGIALLILANIVIYNGYATETNKKEAATMGESEVNIQRRKYAVLVLLQAGIALFRRGSGKVCTEEELRELNQKRVYGE